MRNETFEDQSSFERRPPRSQSGTEAGAEAYRIFTSSGTLTRPARRSAKEKASQREPGKPDSRLRVQRDNLMLAALPSDERNRLRPFLEMVEYEQSRDLILPDEPIRDVYFPINMVTSTLQELKNGASIESGLMGVEGMVGIQFWLRQRTTPTHTLVQIAGRAYRMSSRDFEREVMQRPESPLNGLIAGYIHAFLNMTGQTAACNRMHEVETRLARWLCLVYDRVLETDFDLRHEFLATMLGVHRPSVTIAAKTLQRAGLIRYSRGHVEILDPVALSNSACECLGLIEAQFDNMFGKSWREPA